MKISKIEVSTREITLKKPFKTAVRTATSIDEVLVSIHSDDGTVGYGAASPTPAITGDSLESIKAAVKGPIQNKIIQRDLRELQTILKDVEKSCIGNTSAKAAVDIALHDLYCRCYDIPLFQLLGGGKANLETDVTISVDEPDVMVQDTLARLREGFDTLKIKAGKHWEKDYERIMAIREAAGQQITLRIDANQGWEAKQAVRLIRKLEAANFAIELIEQPVPYWDIEGLHYVTANVETPVMADESLFSPRDALRLIEMKAADLLNIKLMKAGGIRPALQIASIAEAAGIECMIGSMMESIVSVSAAVHVAAAHPNITKFDLDAPLWLQDDRNTGIQYSGKHILLNNGPGLGVGNFN